MIGTDEGLAYLLTCIVDIYDTRLIPEVKQLSVGLGGPEKTVLCADHGSLTTHKIAVEVSSVVLSVTPSVADGELFVPRLSQFMPSVG